MLNVAKLFQVEGGDLPLAVFLDEETRIISEIRQCREAIQNAQSGLKFSEGRLANFEKLLQTVRLEIKNRLSSY